jgi:Tfp pilus assembly protein PilF
MPTPAQELLRQGLELARAGHLQQAADCFRQAAAADPTLAHAHSNLGRALELLGDLPAAIASYEMALRIEPAFPKLACKLGTLYAQQGQLGRALACLEQALRTEPDDAVTLNNLGIVLAKLERLQEATVVLRRAIALAPLEAGGYANLGGALVRLDQYDEAEQVLQRAIQLAPRHPDAHLNLGLLRKEQGRIDEALSHYEISLAERFDSAEAHKNRGLSLFLKGQFKAGWPEYQWRLKLGDVRVLHQAPQWDGSPLAGRTLLLETEQGMGDAIQFVRYAALVKEQFGGRNLLACEPPLVPLLKTAPGIDQVISQKEPRPPFDAWSPLLSLPGVFRRGTAEFPANVPYLSAEPGRVERWRERLANVPGFKIGIVWQGNRAQRSDHKRSFPLAALAPLAKVAGVRLISLQKGEGADQIGSCSELRVVSLGDDFDASGGAFLDSAAVMQSLDLVISADTSIAHLAGALAVPVWVALGYVPDWRWTMTGERTPWYPTMRLFRQSAPGDWAGVFERMAAELERQVSARHAPAE